jgi:hypothetical protein
VFATLGFNISRECPKCHADRTLLDTCYGLPGYVEPHQGKASSECINVASALPVRVILCPRCHYLEMYHDVRAKH